jgi:hypothetical protein
VTTALLMVVNLDRFNPAGAGPSTEFAEPAQIGA